MTPLLNQSSRAKSMEQFHNIMGRAGVCGEKAKSKRCVSRCFLNVATEVAEWTDSGRLFQREGAGRKSEMLLHLHWS